MKSLDLIARWSKFSAFLRSFLRYRLAPAHHFPVAYEDVYRVVKHFLQTGVLAQYSVDPGRVVVSGDSAGGNLAAAVSQQVKKHFLLHSPDQSGGSHSQPTSVLKGWI